MVTSNKKMANNGQEVAALHKKLLKKPINDLEKIQEFENFLNLVAKQPFLNKCEDFLLFIEHCMPTDKCNTFNYSGDIKVYNQISVDKAPSVPNAVKNFITKPCTDQEQNRTVADRDNLTRDYFITITSDGILKSDNHPM